MKLPHEKDPEKVAYTYLKKEVKKTDVESPKELRSFCLNLAEMIIRSRRDIRYSKDKLSDLDYADVVVGMAGKFEDFIMGKI